jgi:FkbM family methyltransferase
LAKALFCNQVLAGAEHRHVLPADLSTVVDIGANRGQFTLAVRQWAPNAKVIAFEPLSKPADKYRKIFRRDSAVILYQVAIGADAGTATIHVAAADDSSSLLPISPLQERIFPGTGPIGVERVKIGQLADYISPQNINPPAMLKLDVQGFELQALHGCEELLNLFSHVYVECSFKELYEGQALAGEIIEWLHVRNFALKGIYNPYYDANGMAIQGDFLFLRSHIN